jgi:NADPH:quinone reductase-like Zn-dependent oxidoreductase
MTAVVRFHELGGPDVLRLEDLEVPPPGKSEVKIRVEAIGLNRAELAFRAVAILNAPSCHHVLATKLPGLLSALALW